MIHTDGHPTIAWADPVDIDPTYQVLKDTHDKFDSKFWRWVNWPATPTSCGGKACIGLALAETVRNKLDTTERWQSTALLKSAEQYLYNAIDGNNLNADDANIPAVIYNWNDSLTTKSGRRSVLRALKRAMNLRRNEIVTG